MWNASILSPKPLSPAEATMMVVLSAMVFGLVPLFAKALSHGGVASPAIAFYRYLLTALLLLPALTFTCKKRSATFWAMSAGLAAGLGWIFYVEALKSVPVATVAVIYMTYPLFTLLIATIWLRPFPARRSILAGLLTLLAALIALTPALVGTDSLKPLLFSFLAPLTFGYAVVILSDKVSRLAPLERLAGFSFGAVLGLLPVTLSLDSSVVIPSGLADCILILAMAIITTLLPQLLYVMAAPIIGSARAAIAGSFELPVMFVVGGLAFGEQITLLQYVAGLLVLMAIWMTFLNRSENVSEEVEVEVEAPPTSAKTTNA